MSKLYISVIDENGIQAVEQILKHKLPPSSPSYLDKLEEDLRWGLPLVYKFNREMNYPYITFSAETDDLFVHLCESKEEVHYNQLIYSVRVNSDQRVVELVVEPQEIMFPHHYGKERLTYLRNELLRIKKAHMRLDDVLWEFARSNEFLYDSPFHYRPEIPEAQAKLPLDVIQ